MPDARRPVSTYRLQLSRRFRFADAGALLPYLDDLGITDCYSSPILKATPGSSHGYDICDHRRLNPELGSDEEFAAFCDGARVARLRPSRRLRPQPHVGRPDDESVVARRARERPELALRGVLRHRLGAGQARAERQGAAAAPRRSVRPRARARRAPARLRERRAAPPVLRPRPADQPAPGAAGARDGARAPRADARRRSGAARVSEHPHRAAEPAGVGRAGRDARGRAPAREGSGARASRASAWRRRAPIRAHIESRGADRERRARRSRQLRSPARAARAAGRIGSRTGAPPIDEINYRRFFDINELVGLRME